MDEYKNKHKDAMDLKYFAALRDVVTEKQGKLTVKWDGSDLKIKVLIGDFEWYSNDYLDTFEDAYLMFMEDWLDYSE